jgi:MraZ protein
MGQFVSSFTNKIDSKGRVSVPASFRAILAKEEGGGIYCYPSLDAPALDAGGSRLVNQIGELLEELAPYGDEKDQLATALYGDSIMMKIDSDGRINLPLSMREHAGIKDKVVFVGLGGKFQIWEPEKFEAHRLQAREKVRELRKLLGAGRRPKGGGEAEGGQE